MKINKFLRTQYFIGFFILSSLLSCDYFIKKTTPVTITPTPIDYSSIDAYPLLDACAHLTSRKEQQTCFYKLLSKQIENSLKKENIPLYTLKDTIQVNIMVNSKGHISATSVNLDTLEFKILKDAIYKSVKSLPNIAPAIKSGIPITSTYILPIVVINTKITNDSIQ